MAFSALLKKRREDCWLTLRDAARIIGISHSMLWRYENGVQISKMKVETLTKISEFYGWDSDEIQKEIQREMGKRKKK